ncbi:hypothetical protein F4778DRAFT_217451 [Xylariomycetidae sp. FL2044]|nr:hypothetical protein F4778DRAFT_217451 [Xylariomycetidae sp. FL2044]
MTEEAPPRISKTPVPLPTYGQPVPRAPPPPTPQVPAVAAAPAASSEVRNSTEAPPATAMPAIDSNARDVAMTDAASLEQAPSQAFGAALSNAPSPAPARTGTPLRTNGQETTSRATSQHPDAAPAMPTEAPPHGDPVRRYLNTKVTGVLLEGMKKIAREQPSNPLQVLGEYLIKHSQELET